MFKGASQRSDNTVRSMIVFVKLILMIRIINCMQFVIFMTVKRISCGTCCNINIPKISLSLFYCLTNEFAQLLLHYTTMVGILTMRYHCYYMSTYNLRYRVRIVFISMFAEIELDTICRVIQVFTYTYYRPILRQT